MLKRAAFLQSSKFNTLCIDLQAHGESEGTQITMGHLESIDAKSGVQFLRNRFPFDPIIVVGSSLGAASALMAPYNITPDAFIIEAAFSDLETALTNRLSMSLGKSGNLLAPILTLQIKPRLGVSSKEISPLKSAASITTPTLIIVGGKDQHATPKESREIYEALGGKKELLRWLAKMEPAFKRDW